MEIDRIYYPVKVLGYGDRIGIWTVGCPHQCKGCSNPELWTRDSKKEISIEKVFKLIDRIEGRIHGITITGGEPFLQPKELLELVKSCLKRGIEDIIIYTGYTLQELKTMKDSDINQILNNIAILIDGKYIEEFNDNKPLKGSSNQIIYVLNKKYEKYVSPLLNRGRTVQNVFYSGAMMSIGIPIKGYRQKTKDGLLSKGIIYNSL